MTQVHDTPAAGGRSIRCYDTGERDDTQLTVFWHHGTPQTGRLYEPLISEAATRRIRLVSCARAGYEGTTPIAARSVADAAADVITAASALGIERFATMGASGGGPHAIACAALAPERVVGVVTLAGIAPYTDEFDWFDGMVAPGGLRAALRGRDERARFAATAEFDLASFTATDWHALETAWAALGEDAQRGGETDGGGEIDDDVAFTSAWGIRLEETPTPTLVVQGGDDRVVPAAHGRRLAQTLPRAELWLRPRDGHVSVMSATPVALDWLVDLARSRDL